MFSFARITHLGTAAENEAVTRRGILPSLPGVEELTVGVQQDPGMVYFKRRALGLSGRMQGLKTPAHRGCGPHPGGDGTTVGDRKAPLLLSTPCMWFYRMKLSSLPDSENIFTSKKYLILCQTALNKPAFAPFVLGST